MEDKIGSIEVGKLADFTILDQDIMTIPEDDILKTQVMMSGFEKNMPGIVNWFEKNK